MEKVGNVGYLHGSTAMHSEPLASIIIYLIWNYLTPKIFFLGK